MISEDSTSLVECLERVGDVSGLTAPATCASEGAAEYYRTQSLPRQVMSIRILSTRKRLAEERTQRSNPRTHPQNARTKNLLLQSEDGACERRLL